MSNNEGIHNKVISFDNDFSTRDLKQNPSTTAPIQQLNIRLQPKKLIPPLILIGMKMRQLKGNPVGVFSYLNTS